jgi:hypothetical protein
VAEAAEFAKVVAPFADAEGRVTLDSFAEFFTELLRVSESIK